MFLMSEKMTKCKKCVTPQLRPLGIPTEKTLRWNTIVIGVFLNLGSVSHKCRQYQFLRGDNVNKGWRNFFQRESHQRV
jgi:hypothetical protein